MDYNGYSSDSDSEDGIGSEAAIGIDLGTTYCCVAVFQNGRAEVISNDQGSRTTPSTVAFTSKERMVGDLANFQRMIDPANTVYNSKRFIGRKFDDPVVQEHKDKYPFQFREKNNRVNFRVEYLDKSVLVSPEEVGAALLEKMKEIAEDYLETEVTNAVITVPAYFSDAQRKATKDAGKIAGLNVMRVINEPTAAAIAYGLNTNNKNKEEEEDDEDDDETTILVYDLGGGTFDVSVLELNSSGVFQVKATSGNTFLGGEDFTQRLVKHFREEIWKRFGVESLHAKAERRLTNACEKAKRDLSSTNGNEVLIELDELIPGGKDFNSKITRAKFESLCMDLFKKTTSTVKEVLKEANVSKEDISEVILIGGSTRIPKIRHMLKNMFSSSTRLNWTINPDEAVACGAAIQAAILNGDKHASLEDTLLLDVNPLSLGMNLHGGVTKVVIERNSMIPVKNVITGLANAATNATTLRCTIVEGERPLTADNTILGSFNIEGVPPGPAGSQKFSMEFDLDSDGILTVTATHRETGKQHGITLDSCTSGRLTTEEINELITKAEQMRQIDERESKRVLARSAVEYFCTELRLELTSQHPPDINSDNLLKLVREQMDWLRNNPESSEVVYHRELEKLKEEVSKTRKYSSSHPTVNMNNNYGAKYQSLSSCLEEGDQALNSGNYEKAQQWFIRALKVTDLESEDKKCYAILKIGETYLGMAKNQMLIQGCTYQGRAEARAKVWDLLKQGASWLVHGLKIGSSSSSSVKMVAELDKIKDMIFDKFIQFYHTDYQLQLLREFLQILQNLETLRYFGAQDILMRSIIQYLLRATAEIERLLDAGLSQMDHGIRSTKQIFIYLDQLSEPIQRLLALETDAKIYNVELRGKEFRKFVDNNRALTETIKIIVDSEEIMEELSVDDIDVDEKINIAFHLIDNMKQAKKNARNNMKLFCKSKLLEGKVYQNLLFNENKARNCYREVMDIALVQGYVLEGWFLEAQTLYQKLRIKMDKVDEEKVQNSRAKVMEELQTEMKQLTGAKNLLLDEFVDFLFENFPPKHKKNAKKPKVEDMCDPTKKKKVYITLCSYYHPDKIDATKFGTKYKVLCEEIAKVVNERYGSNCKGI